MISIISGGKTDGVRNKGRDQGGDEHFQCLQCISMAIIKKPAMVT